MEGSGLIVPWASRATRGAPAGAQPYFLYGEHLRAQIGPRSSPGRDQSACLRRNAGISISSMPLLASASTLAAAVRPLRHTLGVVSPL